MLREGFVNSWVLAKDLTAIADRTDDVDVKQLCATLQRHYTYPVDSLLLGADMKVLGQQSVEELHGLPALYLPFLQQGLRAAERPPVEVAAADRGSSRARPRSLVLTPQRPSVELLEVLTVRGFGKSSFVYHSIDASAFPDGGVFEVEVRLGGAALGATFELCAPIEVEEGSRNGRVAATVTGPVLERSLTSNGSTTMQHPFRAGGQFGFAVRPAAGEAGDTNAWFATVRIRQP